MPAIDPTALGASLSRLEATYRQDELEPRAMLQQVVVAADELFGLSGAGLMLIDSEEALRYVAASVLVAGSLFTLPLIQAAAAPTETTRTGLTNVRLAPEFLQALDDLQVIPGALFPGRFRLY